MDCPRCNTEMAEEKYEGNPVHRCSSCKGWWIRGEVLLNIINRREKIIPDRALEAARKWRAKVMPREEMIDELICPECHGKLVRTVYAYDSGIIIDRCPICSGIWLDNGELTALQAFDEVWDIKSREIFEQKGLAKVFKDMENEEDPETAVIKRSFLGRSIIGRLADMLVDYLD